MRNLIIGIVCILAMSSFVSIESSDNIITNDNNVLVVDDYGCASDCVRLARGLVMDEAEDNGDNPNDHQIYMDVYLALYNSCYSRC